MRNQSLIFLFLCFFISGCSYQNSQTSVVSESALAQATLIDLTLVNYNSSTATLKVQGSLSSDVVTSLNPIDFYSTNNCKGTSLGYGILSDFSGSGIQITVSSTLPTKLYIGTNTLTGCYYVTEYSPNYGNPSAPIFISTNPGSPSAASYTPAVKGISDLVNGTVNLYKDSGCLLSVGSGSTSDYNGFGIIATLTAESINSLYAQVVDSFLHKSACTLMTSYQHTTVGPPAPVFVKTIPVSPSNTTLSPSIFGSVSGTATSVKIYADSGCSVMVGSDTVSNFSVSGIAVTLQSNQPTQIYAKAFDAGIGASACTYMTTYIHDSVAPSALTFNTTVPLSPTNATLYPMVKGFASSDTATVKFFNSVLCLSQIGSGIKSDFESAGVAAGVLGNTFTSIFAQALDAAGNKSTCTLMTNFENDTITPDAPTYSTTTPLSPTNLTTTPMVFGDVPPDAVTVKFFSENLCAVNIGQGAAVDFAVTGIQISVTNNAATTVYAQTFDLAGNSSDCTFLTDFLHSTAASPPATFTTSTPLSPSKVSTQPIIIGSTPVVVASVELFKDALCTPAQSLGATTRVGFMTVGIQAVLPANYISNIYNITVDVYGNLSPCTLLTTYTHTDVIPNSPTYSAIAPTSPTNITNQPLVTGTTTVNPARVLDISEVAFYDSPICITKTGAGIPTDFSGLGIQTTVAANMTAMIYARTIDPAGNNSPCVYFTSYVYDTLLPGKPLFGSVLPLSPSYNANTTIIGTISSSTDIVGVQSVGIYKDAACTAPNLLASGTPIDFQTSGIAIIAPSNVITAIYGNTVNVVGNLSICNKLTDFRHYDLGPSGLVANTNLQGSVQLSWSMDAVSSPIPKYQVKRSIKSGGPYSVLAWTNNGTNFTDLGVKGGQTYYYVVTASNNTGESQNSSQVSKSITTSGITNISDLAAVPDSGKIDLTWSASVSSMYYMVFRSSQNGGPYTLIKNNLTSGSSYSDTSAVNGTNYYYVVKGVSLSGETPYSNEVSAVALAAPPAPTNLIAIREAESAACGGNPGIHLSWTAPSYYTGLKIHRGMSTFTSTGNSYDDCTPEVTLIPNYNSYYLTGIFGLQAESLASNFVSIANMSSPAVTLKPGDSQILITWGLDNDAQSFRIWKSTNLNGPYTVLQASAAGTVYIDTAVVNGTAYYYIVEAEYSGSGIYGFPSVAVGAIPAADPTPVAIDLVLSVNSSKLPFLSWTKPAKYNEFVVSRASTLGGTYTDIKTQTNTSYADTAPLSGMNYYKIRSKWGSVASSYSNIVSFRHGVATLSVSATASNITLTWTAVTGASNYQILRSITSQGPYTQLNAAAATPYIDSTVVAGVGYYYVVLANFADLTIGQSSNEKGIMTTGFTKPGSLTVTKTTTGSVDLAWVAVPGATRYKIYKGTVSGSLTFCQNQSASMPATTVTCTLNPGTTYYFAVSSVDSTVPTAIESAQSNEVTAYTISPISSGPTLKIGSSSIEVNWSDCGVICDLLRTTDGTAFTSVVSGLAATTFTDGTVINGTTYFYKLIRHYGPLTGDFTSDLSAAGTPGIIPTAPQGLAVKTNTTGTDIELAWPAVSDATTYRVYWSTISGGFNLIDYNDCSGSGCTISLLITHPTPTTTTTIPLTPGTVYYFALKALNGSNESAGYSNEISIIPLATPNKPMVVVNNTTGKVDLSWGAVASAASYDISRSSDSREFSPLISVGALTSFSDTTVIDATTYYYRFTPIDAAGIKMATSNTSDSVTPGIKSLAPTNLVANAVIGGLNPVSLSWIQVRNANSNADTSMHYYRIYRSTTSGNYGLPLGPNLLFSYPISNPLTIYDDTSTVLGTTYYYIVRSVNSSGVESANSNEVAVAMIATPISTLAATANGPVGAIDLSWSALAGVTNYNILRGDSVNGPFGQIGNVAAGTLNFLDTSVQNGVTYYYAVRGVYAGGSISPLSNVANATGLVQINLQVPIELTDRGLSSGATPTAFERTQTSLNTADYDGAVTYDFEAVVRNTDFVSRQVNLLDSANGVIASLAVPSGTTQRTRIRTSGFVPVAGRDVYRVQLEGTNSNDQLIVESARILVNQTGATKTRLYIPLLGSTQGPNAGDANAPIETTSSLSYAQLAAASIYKRDTSVFSTIEPFNAWELEALVSASNGASGVVGFNNTTRSLAVGYSEAIFSSSAVTMVNSIFSEGATNFDIPNELELFEPAIRCYQYCTTGSVSLHKAALWVSLKNLKKAEVIYRNSLGYSASGAATMDSNRALYQAAQFSNPSVAIQAVAIPPVGGSVSVYLLSDTTSDVGGGSLSAVAGSTLTFSAATKSLQRSALGLPMTDLYRYMPVVTPSGGTGPAQLIESSIVIQFYK